MIEAFINFNSTNDDLLFRRFAQIPKNFEEICLKVLANNSSSAFTQKIDRFDFSCIKKDELYFGILSQKILVSECFNLLNHLKSVLSNDFISNLLVIDETFTDIEITNNLESDEESSSDTEDEDVFFKRPATVAVSQINYDYIPINDLQALIRGETVEEKMLETMLKAKEKESNKKYVKKQKSAEIEQQLQKVRNLELEMRNEQLKQIEQLKKMQETANSKPITAIQKKKRTVDVDCDVLITIKERLNVVVDKDNNLKECFLNGDLSILLKNQEFKKQKIEFIKIKNCDLKLNPNIDKNAANKNILSCDKGYPLNKNVALIKWKRKISNPVNFSFWVSEQENGSLVQFEIESDLKVDDLTVSFQKNDVNSENPKLVKKDLLEWNVGDENCLELTCGNYENLFPVFIDFWCDDYKTAINIQETENMKVLRVLEVEKFEIVC